MNRLISVLLFFFAFSVCVAQETNILTLKDVIQIARGQSPASLRAETRKENRYWQYRTFRSNYVPQLRLDGTFPDFQRQFSPITQDDGTVVFQPLSQNNSNLSLSLRQTVTATGGEIFVNTRLDRFDDFDRDIQTYSGTPFSFGLIQPIFSFNQLLWDKEIEPLRFEESKREYVEELEDISILASGLFFDLMIAQISLAIAETNVVSNDTIYQIAQGRYELGKIPENDLLQLELNLMNSRQQKAQAELDLETSTLFLSAYLGFSQGDKIQLILPEDLPEFDVDEQMAITQAKQSRQEAIAFNRRRKEAAREVARARGESGLNANMFATFGLTNRGDSFREVYKDPDDQQTLRVGFSIPILDWGRQKSRVKTAEANEQLVQYTVDQDEKNFEQEVFTQVKQFKMLRDQVDIANQADQISQRRYNIAKNRYLIGKISITDLSLALTEKDVAKRTYINALRNFWQAYYNLRKLTLYDFEENQPLYVPE